MLSFERIQFLLMNLRGKTMSPTIRDVARRAGVSVGTVSHVLNGSATVSEATRARVLEAIRELDYHPDEAARTLRRRTTGTIGLVRSVEGGAHMLTEANDYVFLEFLAGAQEVTMREGIGILLWAASPGPSEEEVYRRLVRGRRVDGFLLLGTRTDDWRVHYLEEQGVPFVAFGRAPDGGDFPYVDVDGEKALVLITEHLVYLGHRRIGYIEPPKGLMCAVHRRNGYLSTLERHHTPVDERLIIAGGFTWEDGERAMRDLMYLPDPPTAVIAPNDVAAMGAVAAARVMGLEVGRDISVVGFDDIPLAAYWEPPLTTVHQPARWIGAEVTRMLLALLSHGSVPSLHVLVSPELRVRQSTGPAPQPEREQCIDI